MFSRAAQEKMKSGLALMKTGFALMKSLAALVYEDGGFAAE